jgi:hypothetical protein
MYVETYPNSFHSDSITGTTFPCVLPPPVCLKVLYQFRQVLTEVHGYTKSYEPSEFPKKIEVSDH